MADHVQGFSGTIAPLALRDRIIAGISGAEFGVRAFIDAYDPATGKRLWRFNSIPGPGEFGNSTWEGDSWSRGGASTWMTGTYDPESDTLYWGIGNPGPDLNGDVRKGDNLFSCSVVALDPNTGKSKWHFQTGAPIDSSPISFAVEGTQFVALSAGSVLYCFALPATL